MNKNHEQPNEFFKPKYIYVLADCGDRKGYRFVTAVEREGCLYQGSDEEETELVIKQMDEDPKMANKPEQVKAKIAEGKVGKYYSENCLMEQTFVKDNSMTIKQYVDSKAKEAGAAITVTGYVCFELGEGIEKKADNFADEVASMIG